MIYLIGASTGGPGLLEKIITSLSTASDDILVIAQHMDRKLLTSLAKRFERLSPRHVVLVTERTILQKGHIYILSDTFAFDTTQNEWPTLVPAHASKLIYHPSIDPLFASAATLKKRSITAILLSGIGADGVSGMKRLKTADMHTIAQDERSSVVFGMPKRAIENQAAQEVLSIDAIAKIIGGQ